MRSTPVNGGASLGTPWDFLVALGIGLLLGLERERRKGSGPGREAAGVRTFALVALLGALSMQFAGVAVLAMAGAFVGLATLAAYVSRRSGDPGLTTEVALVVAFLLGALTVRDAVLAAGLGVGVTILLAARDPLHRFVRDALSPQELHDALLFGAAALVVLPLVPDRGLGPYGVFNPFTIWRLVVIVMAISVGGYLATRLLGPRFGLPLAGMAGGFVSSAATVGAMGARAMREPALARPAVAAAVLSSVSTVVQMAIVVGATSPAVLAEIVLPLVAAGLVAVAYGAVFTVRSARSTTSGSIEYGRAFDLKTAVGFACTLTLVLLLAAVLEDFLGQRGVVLATAVAGFADSHSAAISAAALAASGKLTAADAAVPILVAFTTNTITKLTLAGIAGRRRYLLQLAPGLVLMAVAAWAGLLVSRAL